ncbi:MAG: DUF2281 domain-containing protein [Clostridia bacterium]|nr:DUF2281 domain-containing protein [Clostridia bacterium]
MLVDLLIQEARGMTDDTLMEVVHFMQYLKTASMRKASYLAAPASPTGNVYREPGLYKGQIKIASGFDDPLDDFKEYL